MSNPKNSKTIAISKGNYEQLRQLGHTPESFNDIVTKLLKGAPMSSETENKVKERKAMVASANQGPPLAAASASQCTKTEDR